MSTFPVCFHCGRPVLVDLVWAGACVFHRQCTLPPVIGTNMPDPIPIRDAMPTPEAARKLLKVINGWDIDTYPDKWELASVLRRCRPILAAFAEQGEHPFQDGMNFALRDINTILDLPIPTLVAVKKCISEIIMARNVAMEALAKHDLCHDLHGKVDAKAFADGCAAEQRKLYGCAPHADRLARAEAECRAGRSRLLPNGVAYLTVGPDNGSQKSSIAYATARAANPLEDKPDA